MKKLLIALIAASTAMVGCTRIEDGSVGIRKSFNGEIQDQVLEPDWYGTVFSSVIPVSSRNIIIPVNSVPVVKEGIPMAKFELKVNYGIVPSMASVIYKTEKNQHITTEDGDVYLLAQYVDYVARSSVSDVISKYPAMDVNRKRDEIESGIKEAINRKLTEQGKSKYVRVNEINILAVEPPASIVQSVQKIIQTENERQAKTNELEVAKLETQKMEILARQADDKYIALIEAEAKKTTAEGIKIAATKGSLVTYIVPDKFTGLNTGK